MLFALALIALIGIGRSVFAQTKVDLRSSEARATILGSVNILEQPSNPSGDTFDVIGHNRAYALKVWRGASIDSGGLLLPQSMYTLSWPEAKTVRIKLATPLQLGEWVAWEKWAP